MRTNEMVVFDSIAHSNLPSRNKSAVLGFLERYMGGSPGVAAKRYGSSTLSRMRNSHPQQHMVRQQGEAMLFGALLAAAKNTVGLDAGTKKIPVDAVTGMVGLGLGALLAHKGIGFATECNNLAASAFTIFSFRKMDGFMGGKSLLGTTTSKVAGEDDEDPILACAQDL
jgi:hypothetical protein